jgi:hypothetical protein
MKQNTAKSQTVIVEENRTVAKPSETGGADCPGFAHQLRALGQALEKFSFSAFDLEIRSGTYLVRGQAISSGNVKFSFSRFVRELLRGTRVRPIVSCSEGQVDLRFSPDEIECFDVRGKIKRQDPNKMPDPYSISQILRGAGS